MFGAPPLNPKNIIWHCPLQTPQSRISKNTFSGPWCTDIWVFGALPLNPNNIFLALSISNTPILGIQKHLFWPMVCRRMSVWGATPEPKQFFWHCPLQTPQSQISKNTFSGPWCTNGCLGRHPRTQRILFGIVHCKQLNPRYPKTPFLAHGVQTYGCLGRHP